MHVYLKSLIFLLKISSSAFERDSAAPINETSAGNTKGAVKKLNTQARATILWKLGLADTAKKKNEPKKRITNKPAGKCHAQNVINIESGSRPESHFFQMELMKIKTAGNHAELKKKRL